MTVDSKLDTRSHVNMAKNATEAVLKDAKRNLLKTQSEVLQGGSTLPPDNTTKKGGKYTA